MKKKGLYIFHSFLIWGLYLLSFYIATFALKETASISFSTLIITFVIGSFSFAFTNSGFGAYPFFVASILAVFSIPETVGTAFGWIVWTTQNRLYSFVWRIIFSNTYRCTIKKNNIFFYILKNI